MKISSGKLVAAGLLALVASGACGTGVRESVPAAVQPPGNPGEAARPADAAVETGLGPRRHTEADVRFMQGMIAHHAQALEMASLVPSRTDREEIRRLAQRIDVSQADEIALMRRWLEERGEEVPGAGGHGGHAVHHDHAAHHANGAHHDHAAAGGHDSASMPGMLTREELARLAQARGAEFERLFLEFMIRHHEGALVMVAELFGSQGAGQEPEIFRFASDVDADQRAEIARMRRLLDSPPAGASHR